ncbi:MAG: AAA family ATPase [Candidatus Aenigmarchaeota archaeon]|nr:AAA family ATPase [Candidatus Aenigmarchaeota archaeon]
MIRTIIAIVGMPGAGRTVVSKMFEEKGFYRIRFGDITDNELKKRAMGRTEENERFVRESLRVEYGPAAYAKMSLVKIKKAASVSKNIVIDGLYSLEEFMFLRKKFPELVMMAVLASPEIRHERLIKLENNPFTLEECVFRDISMLENLKLGGPICLADYFAVNEGNLSDLRKSADKIFEKLIK